MSQAMPDNVVELLSRMVRINSVSAAASGRAAPESILADLLESLAKGWGLATRRLPVPLSGNHGGDNLLVMPAQSAAKNDPRPWLLLVSHMDTVALDGMTIDPLGAQVRDGKMWGRGACDTKGTGAAMLWALVQTMRLPNLPNNLAILFTIDEESLMLGVKTFVGDQLSTLGFLPRAVIVGEPTRLRPIATHNGVLRWSIRTIGRSCHSSDPSRGRSAISDMVRLIDAIESRYIPSLTTRDPLTGKAQCSVNVIRGGAQDNVIPDACVIQVDRRLAPQETARDAHAAMQATLQQAAQTRPGMQYEVQISANLPPLSRRHNQTLVQWVGGHLKRLGLTGEPCGEPYGTEAGFLDQAGLPAVVLGPGDIAQAHTKDEFLDLAQLNKGVEVYQYLMTQPLA